MQGTDNHHAGHHAGDQANPPSRVIIDSITPNLEDGRYAARRALGEAVHVEAVLLCDGHEILKADLLYRAADESAWRRVPMAAVENDRYRASFQPEKMGLYYYTVEAAIDRFAGWRDGFFKKWKAGEATAVDVEIGLELIDSLIEQDYREPFAPLFSLHSSKLEAAQALVYDRALEGAIRDNWHDPSTVRYPHELKIRVDSPRAAYSSWYEFFPRSQWRGVAEQGTLRDAVDRLPYIAGLGFDVVYLPPIHPIGEAYRKGRNNARQATAGDPGSPWAIGGKEGGHKSIHPDLGTFDDFAALVDAAQERDMQVALDIAFQCSPDHPYVKDHPQWFKKRADGSIQYAENPPKKYHDIYPFDFECEDWRALWEELKSVITFWIERGVRIFRVDNPHTKSFAFWEWAIGDIHEEHPDIVFLAEAFTRPGVMAYLAKIGFNQSYTYFAWRHDKHEFTQYMEELTQSDLRHYFRPNFWPNTPDILTETLQTGGRTAFVQRLLLAATLSSNYGIYGPAFELMEHLPAVPGKEEYLNSEKYETRLWDIDRSDSLAPLIRRVNRIRHTNPALQTMDDFMFHPVDNPQMIAFTRRSADRRNLVLVVANLDLHHAQSGIVDLQIHKLGIPPGRPYRMHELLSGAKYQWQDWRNYVALDPQIIPVQIFRIEHLSEDSVS